MRNRLFETEIEKNRHDQEMFGIQEEIAKKKLAEHMRNLPQMAASLKPKTYRKPASHRFAEWLKSFKERINVVLGL